MTKKNCWEELMCGRQDECPAYPDNGRNCFAVTATLCRGDQQGSYQEKIEECRKTCGFYEGMMSGQV